MAIFRRIVLVTLSTMSLSLAHRSVHRPADTTLPEIVTYWTDTPNRKGNSLRSSYLEEWALFDRYNPKSIEENLLPSTLSYRYDPTQSVQADMLNSLIEEFIAELFRITIKPDNRSFKNFIILKDRNFNYRMHAGLIILKFKHYPFVVKLFIENPESFTRPYTKGTETSMFFIMGGGMNRFLAGFTRIPNLAALREVIEADPAWRDRIILPRKWYWLPRTKRTFTVVGKNIGPRNQTQSLELPSIYGIICDEINMERQLNTFDARDRALVYDIINLLGNRLDPHIYNFFIEKGTGKIAIIDTEHFASMVGIRGLPMEYNTNFGWYVKLANKCIKDSMFRTKSSRITLQSEPIPPALMLHPREQ